MQIFDFGRTQTDFFTDKKLLHLKQPKTEKPRNPGIPLQTEKPQNPTTSTNNSL